MKKIDFINAIMENNGNETKTKDFYTITKDNFDNLLFDVDGVKIHDNGKNEKYVMFGNSKVIIKIVSKNKEKTDKLIGGGNGHKSKNTGYIIILKNMDDKKPTTINNIENCSQIKSWIKSLNRKNIEYLHIFDSMNNECRKSAWIDKTTK